jgi:hypothetical protein
MTSKERLRALLDERGIEYTICMPWNDTAWEHDGTHFTATERFGKIYLQTSQGPMTPEQAIAATVGVGTCHYIPDDVGFTWWDENDVEHYEEDSASYECDFASCDKCGYSMMVGDCGWFDGWDEITEWTEEDGSEHKGYVLKPRFNFCPKCGARVVSA